MQLDALLTVAALPALWLICLAIVHRRNRSMTKNVATPTAAEVTKIPTA